MDWRQWRAEFPILARRTYLNSCSLGALSIRSEARVRQFHEEWHTYGASAWYDRWLGRLDELRGRVAGLLGATPTEIALTASTSASLSAVASALDHGARNRVVVSELDFPTVAYQWLVRPGVEVVRVPSDDGATIDLARFADAIDERTAVLATSHVMYTSGAIQDLGSLAEIARASGALFLVDAYQSAGQIPIDVRVADIDVLTAGPLKWLLGGPGVSYLYVREQLIERLRPTIAGWFGAKDQFDFDGARFRFKGDARRFESGTPALPTVHAALGGQEIIDEIGVSRIRERNRALTERLIERADAAGLTLRLAPAAHTRSAIIMVADPAPAHTVAWLAEDGIIVDWRPGHVRISPHFYNAEEEVDRVIDSLARRREQAMVPSTVPGPTTASANRPAKVPSTVPGPTTASADRPTTTPSAVPESATASANRPTTAGPPENASDEPALTLRDAQRAVDDWIGQFEEGYWPPLSNLARLVEEVGELSRELNHRYGHKPKRADEREQSLALELGDILFVLVALANEQRIDLADAFARALEKYRVRDASRWAASSARTPPGVAPQVPARGKPEAGPST